MARPKKQVGPSSEQTQELTIRKKQLEILYKELAVIKGKMDSALTQVGFIDSSECLGEAAFKAGRAFNSLDDASDKLEEVLNDLYDGNDYQDWHDIIDEN